MGTNLRLSEQLADALRAASAERGQSQQEIVRLAIARELGLGAGADTPVRRAIAAGLVQSPTPFVDVEPLLTLPDGVSTADLLDRDER